MKPHINAKQLKSHLAVNRAIRRLPFYQQGDSSHLSGTKHSRIYSDYGYPLVVDFWFFYTLYKRCGLAFAGVERPADMTWLTKPKIKLDEDTEDEDFNVLARRLMLWPNLCQLDKMQRVGHYAGLILRVADDKDPSQPMGAITTDDIIEVMPAWEGQLIPGSLDNDRNSRRYGLPVSYTYTQKGNRQIAQRDGNESFTIHHSRVLIWNEGAAGRTIYGTSSIEPAYNACLDWEKIRGAGAEGFFKQAAMRGWLQDTLKGDVQQAGPTDEELEDLHDMLQDMSESFDALPYLGGMELKNFTASLANPEHFKNAALEDAAAGFKWSAKGLIGSQEGQLAGEQDSSLDKQSAQSRRENFITYKLYELVEWLNTYCTDFDGERIVEFDDLSAPTDRQRLENGNLMMDMIQKGAIVGMMPYNTEEVREATGWSNEEFEEDDFEDGVDEEGAG